MSVVLKSQLGRKGFPHFRDVAMPRKWPVGVKAEYGESGFNCGVPAVSMHGIGDLVGKGDGIGPFLGNENHFLKYVSGAISSN